MSAGFNQLAQGQPGVGHYGNVHLVVLVQVAGVVGYLDDGLSRGDFDVADVFGEAASHSQDQVGPPHVVVDGAGHHPAGAAQGQGMDLRKDALAGQAAHDRNLEQFGQFQQFVRRTSVKHALAGVDYRGGGSAEGPGRRLDVCRVAREGQGLQG